MLQAQEACFCARYLISDSPHANKQSSSHVFAGVGSVRAVPLLRCRFEGTTVREAKAFRVSVFPLFSPFKIYSDSCRGSLLMYTFRVASIRLH